MDNADLASAITLELNSIERWNVFSRLQELSIPCQCACNRPLQVDVDTASAAVQVWSVIQQVVRPRGDLAAHLEQCWNQEIKL